MSQHFQVLIPRDPHADLPDNAQAVCDALARMVGSSEARVKDYGKLQFIDAGENFDDIRCPSCEAEISLAQWQDWMDADWHGEDGFHLHKHDTPCCGASVTLNTLRYNGPQGFARWIISARNSERPPLSDAQIAELEAMAGLPLRLVLQHY